MNDCSFIIVKQISLFCQFHYVILLSMLTSRKFLKACFPQTLLLWVVVDFRSRCSLSAGRAVSPLGYSSLPGSHLQGSLCAPASTSKTASKRVPRRMPCKKYIQVVGTQESRTLSFYQLVKRTVSTKFIKKESFSGCLDPAGSSTQNKNRTMAVFKSESVVLFCFFPLFFKKDSSQNLSYHRFRQFISKFIQSRYFK
jgi:hypothetical protein